MLLGSLAHNVIVWAQHWLASPTLHHYGTVRMVRYVFHLQSSRRVLRHHLCPAAATRVWGSHRSCLHPLNKSLLNRIDHGSRAARNLNFGVDMC